MNLEFVNLISLLGSLAGSCGFLPHAQLVVVTMSACDGLGVVPFNITASCRPHGLPHVYLMGPTLLIV